MDIAAYLLNPEELERISNGFARQSNGVLRGAIGAIYGWLVKIIKPNCMQDTIKISLVSFLEKVFMH